MALPKQVPSAPDLQSGHVLVVDDEDMVRTLLGSMLKVLGYSVTLAASGAEALRALEQAASSARCVLLDLTMPEQDGNQTFARIRELHPALPVVLMSGYDARAGASADGFLQKPFTLNDLRHVLAQVIPADAALAPAQSHADP